MSAVVFPPTPSPLTTLYRLTMCLDSPFSLQNTTVINAKETCPYHVDIFQKRLQLRYKVEEYNAKILSRDNSFFKIKSGVIMKPYYQNGILNFALPKYVFK